MRPQVHWRIYYEACLRIPPSALAKRHSASWSCLGLTLRDSSGASIRATQNKPLQVSSSRDTDARPG